MSAWVKPPRWAALRKQVFARYGRTCYRCGGFADSVDHIRAVALGGSHDLSNLRPACSRCNSSTGASLGNKLRPRTPPWLQGRRGTSRRQPPRSSRQW